MKRIITKISLTIFAVLIAVTNHALAFSDLPSQHPNKEAIQYLQSNQIISGYPDGTFRPSNKVNRAELLKILIEANKLAIDTSPTPFTDLDAQAWYYEYVTTAYNQGWINGYPDGTFKPNSAVNHAEALKIIAKATNQDLSASLPPDFFNDVKASDWFAPYAYFAKTYSLIDNKNLFFPQKELSRAEISELIFRQTLKAPKQELKTEQPPEEKPVETVPTPTENIEPPTEEPQTETPATNLNEASFVPVAEILIEPDFFNDLTLSSSIPNRFYLRETFFIEGELHTQDSKITLVLENTTTKKQRNFTTSVENNQFSIPVNFNETGTFNFTLIPGINGTNKAIEVSVMPELPASSDSTNPPDNQQKNTIYFQNNKTYIDLSNTNDSLKKIDFIQGQNTVSYYNRQNISALPIQYKDFAKFSEKPITLQVSQANLTQPFPLQISSSFQQTSSQTFTPTTHHFSNIEEDKIQSTYPETLPSPEKISITGTLKYPANIIAYIITPNGEIQTTNLSHDTVTENYFGKEIIPEGANISFSYTPQQTGTYIIEINDKGGEAMINHPVYIGAEVPLLPDFFDLNELSEAKNSSNTNTLRTEMLQFVNQERQALGLSTLKLDSELNDLAQAHSNDMAENSYFAHVNLLNQTPQDRATSAGIKTHVSENIAQHVSIPFAHYSLMRSAAHRANIITPDWSRVGLGITEKDGYLIVAQEFSTKELTEQDYQAFESQLYLAINEKRSQLQLSTIPQDPNIDQAASYFHDKLINEDAVADDNLFSQVRTQYNISGRSQAILRVFSTFTKIQSSILEDEIISTENWDSVGLDVTSNQDGTLYTTVIFNEE